MEHIKLFSKLKVIAVFIHIISPGNGQITCTGSGGFLLQIDDNSNIVYKGIYSAPIPGSTSAADFSAVLVSLEGQILSMAYDQLTATLYWSIKNEIKAYSLKVCDSPVTFITGTENADIFAMTIDETQRWLYWSETSILREHRIWAVPLDGDNNDKRMLYLDTISFSASDVLDIEIDTTNQEIFWAILYLDGSYLPNTVIRRASIASNAIIDSRIFAKYLNGIKLDINRGKILWANVGACHIDQININDLNSGSPETRFSAAAADCILNDFFISLAEDKLYFRSNTEYFEVPLYVNTITLASVKKIVSNSNPEWHAGFNPQKMIFVPSCPKFEHEISLMAQSYTICEGDRNFNVVLKRTGYICYSSSVRVINYGNTASRSKDYAIIINGVPQSVDSHGIEFRNGEANIWVQFEIYEDNLTEGNETFIIELADPSPIASAKLGQITRAIVTIVDKSSYFRFKQISYEATEGDGQIGITIVRVGNLEDPVKVSLVITPGTAQANNDYNPIAPDVVFYPYESEALVLIAINDDNTLENTEFFEISFVQTQEELDNIIISIKDNEIGFTFKEPVYEYYEDAGPVIIPIERIGSSQEEVSVGIVFSAISSEDEDHRAIKDEDYTQFNPDVLVFKVGETLSNIYLEIIEDTLCESTELFQISISSPQTDGSDMVINTTTITILDNEENIRFALNTVTFEEGEETPLKIYIVRDVAIRNTDVFVTTCQEYSSAVQGLDYGGINSATIRFPEGQTVAVTNVIIIDDNIGEGVESFRLVITPESRGSNDCNSKITNDMYVGIIDDDGVTYRFLKDNYVIQEYRANLNVRILKDGIAMNDNQETITLTATSGSATTAQDFMFNGPMKLDFGDTGYTDVLIQIVADNEYEERGETFNLILTNSNGDTLQTVTVTIQDDDNFPSTPHQLQTYSFSESSLKVSESKTLVKIRLLRTQSSDAATLNIDTIPGSAEEASDFLPIKSQTLFFSRGTVLIETNIHIVDDKEFEQLESFQLSLSAPTDGGITTGGLLIITIEDDDEDISQPSMSGATVIGIIIGIAFAVLILIILMCIYFMSSRNAISFSAVPVPRVGYAKQYGQPMVYWVQPMTRNVRT